MSFLPLTSNKERENLIRRVIESREKLREQAMASQIGQDLQVQELARQAEIKAKLQENAEISRILDEQRKKELSPLLKEQEKAIEETKQQQTEQLVAIQDLADALKNIRPPSSSGFVTVEDTAVSGEPAVRNVLAKANKATVLQIQTLAQELGSSGVDGFNISRDRTRLKLGTKLFDAFSFENGALVEVDSSGKVLKAEEITYGLAVLLVKKFSAVDKNIAAKQLQTQYGVTDDDVLVYRDLLAKAGITPRSISASRKAQAVKILYDEYADKLSKTVTKTELKKDLQTKIDNATKEKKDLEDKIAVKEIFITDFDNALKPEIQTLEKEIAVLEKNLKKPRKKLSHIEKEFEFSSAGLADGTKELNDIEKKLLVVEADVKKWKIIHQKEKDEYNKIADVMTVLHDEMTELRQDLTDEESKPSPSKVTINKLNKQLTTRSKKYDELEPQADKLDKSTDALEAKIQDEEKNIAIMKDRINELKASKNQQYSIASFQDYNENIYPTQKAQQESIIEQIEQDIQIRQDRLNLIAEEKKKYDKLVNEVRLDNAKLKTIDDNILALTTQQSGLGVRLQKYKAKKGAGVKIVTSTDDLIDRLAVLVGQRQAGNDSGDLKNEIGQIADLLLRKGMITKNEHKLLTFKYTI